MTWTYDLTTAVGQVRFAIPDTISENAFFTNEEITYALGLVGNDINLAAADCCDQLARKFAQHATFSADGLSVQHGQRATIFAERAKELRQRGNQSYSAISLNRADGYEDNAAETDTDYGGRIVYVRTR